MTRKKKVAAPKSRTWEHELEVRRLNNWADMLVGIPFRHGDTPPPDEMNQILRGFNEGNPLRAPFMGDKERLDIAMYLRGLARMPHVIDAKLAPKRGRGTPVKVRARNFSIALDYQVTQERINLERAKRNRSSTRSASGDAETEVAKAYGVGAKIVTDAYTQCRKSQSWHGWASAFRGKFPLNGIELLQAISDELRAAKSG